MGMMQKLSTRVIKIVEYSVAWFINTLGKIIFK